MRKPALPIVWAIEVMRTAQGLTMTEMCKKAGISPYTYQQWLYSGVSPTYTKLTAVLAVFGKKLEVVADA